MKLYRVGRHWFGTQAEAKAGARQIGAELEQVEVPVDKPGLLTWLNNHTIIDGFPVDGADTPELDPLEQAEQRAIEAARAAAPSKGMVDAAWEANRDTKVAQMWAATDIEDFISSRATAAQVENIFASLGTRFKELVNAAA